LQCERSGAGGAAGGGEVDGQSRRAAMRASTGAAYATTFCDMWLYRKFAGPCGMNGGGT
jgi:hypothetical protein